MKRETIPTIRTIGHSVKPIDTFLAVLKKHRIKVLVDVRSVPQSRFCPHFSKNALQRELSKQDIQYQWRGQNLGGRGVNVGWDDAIEELVALARKGTRVAVMCSEGDYRKCHRYTTLTPAFEVAGLEVVHVQYPPKKHSDKSEKNTPQNPLFSEFIGKTKSKKKPSI